MQLTNENYYSKEANEEYLSVSQYKDFMGTYGKRGCEEYALAKIEGTWEENMEDSDALMVGSYVDAHFEGTLDLFKAKHPCMFKKDGDLTNLHEALHDILVKYHVIADDNCKIIVSTDGSRVLYDRENPRTEVTITKAGGVVENH